MDYLVLTNNPVVKELITNKTDHELHFIDGGVQNVILACEEIFLKGETCLAADPMGGRRARPFPYLTLILEKGKKASAADWERIADYSMLDIRRQDKYRNNSERLNEDFRVLDRSLTEVALKLYQKP